METLMKHFVAWRTRNGLSQRGAVEVLGRMDFGEIALGTLQKWEEGKRAPGRFTAKCLSRFLDEHPVIEDGPRRGSLRRDPTPVKTVEAIKKAREAGETLKAIAERYGLSESSVSRICKGSRRAIVP
jgi:transcriptional regulator with XRE-family HTH domain